MSRHFKKDTFEFGGSNIDKSAKAKPGSSSGAQTTFGEKEFKVVPRRSLINLKWGDGKRVLNGLWQWGKTADKRTARSEAELRYFKHAKGRALGLLLFICVAAYYNPEHSIISRKWHEYRARQIEESPAHQIAKMIAEEQATKEVAAAAAAVKK